MEETLVKEVLDLRGFENPYIQVVWEDTPENFTQEKIKSVKHYFQKKYNTTNVNIITRSKITEDNAQHNVDISFNILDKNYQQELVKKYLEVKQMDKYVDDVLKLDSIVDGELMTSENEVQPFKKWYIKNIEFSNFLSYGENQKIDFEKCDGITSIESTPRNFGGKCVRGNTEMVIEYDVDNIIDKIGFLPKEIPIQSFTTSCVITMIDIFNLFKKYGDIGLTVNTPYGFKKINGCEITEKDGQVLKLQTQGGRVLEGSTKHKVKLENDEFVALSELKVGDKVQTVDGIDIVDLIINEGIVEDLYDIEVDEVRQYYSNGIVSHNSVLSIDLPLFLFFNETTKSSKAEEIFNRFTDKNKVSVKGEIVIDGEEYVILRSIERKKSKSGEWNVKTELDFFKRLGDGELQNFTGEQRRETEKFIKSSIGTKEDFLLTILTTASNLEELIDSKPTARGQVLSRFMGLDFLKRKEEMGKTLYSNYSKSMLSNIYNTETLKTEIEDYEGQITKLTNDNVELNKQLIDVLERIVKGQEFRDNLIRDKHTDIDVEISKLSPDDVKKQVTKLTTEKETVVKDLDELVVIEPKEFYHEDVHDKVKEEYNVHYKDFVKVENSIGEIEKLKSDVSGGIKCEHCGIELMNASITQSKIGELDGLITQKDQLSRLLQDLTGKDQEFVQLKKDFDLYEKNKLIKDKYEITIESIDMKIKGLNEKLQKYYDVQDKILNNNKIEEKIIKAGLRIGELEGEKSKVTKGIDGNTHTIETLNEKIGNNREKIVKIAEESEKEKLYKIYLEIYGKNGISKMIMKTMLPLINSELQRLLENSSHFRLEIRINDKNEVDFIMVDNNTQIEKTMASGSGYERTIASLAVRAVLSKICSLPKPNIIVFDEVFGKVSNDNLELVGEFFIKIKEYFEKIFVITHNPLVANWSDNIIQITKEDNISYINQ